MCEDARLNPPEIVERRATHLLSKQFQSVKGIKNRRFTKQVVVGRQEAPRSDGAVGSLLLIGCPILCDKCLIEEKGKS
jgi:hypothetical protein